MMQPAEDGDVLRAQSRPDRIAKYDMEGFAAPAL
jgi:hypothetical protein